MVANWAFNVYSMHMCKYVYLMQAFRAALQVFTSHASVGDFSVRTKLLTELSSLLGASSWTASELSASVAQLCTYSEHPPKYPVQRGTVEFSKTIF